MIVNFIQELEGDFQGIEDVKHERTIPAEIVLKELRQRVGSGVQRRGSALGQGDLSLNEKRYPGTVLQPKKH